MTAAPTNEGAMSSTMPLNPPVPRLYRADIDGLRAVAVLSVVLYHLNNQFVPGGYVGVDIFFVISGYLITRNIWREMEEGIFSLRQFYLRRIRRIAPAFMTMIAVTLAVGAALLLPHDLMRLGRSALWGVLSASNVYFWLYLDTSYFAESSEEQPLLHTWSLGVEEQFYLLWPLLLIALAVFRNRRPTTLIVVLVVCVVSFVLAELTNTTAQKFSYYMLPTRAGELMVGAMLALRSHTAESASDTRAGPGALTNVSALLGLAAIGWAFWGLDAASNFPGINALVPCVGAAMVIFAGEKNAVATRLLLSNRWMVAVGLVSYSLYLWHWPILAFLRYFQGEVDLIGGAVAVVLMAVLSVLSYRFVELPFRTWRTSGRRVALAIYVTPVVVISTSVVFLLSTNGLKAWIESPAYVQRQQAIETQLAPAYRYNYVCQLSRHDASILSNRRCLVNAGSDDTGMLLWGDSKAAQFVGLMGELAKREGFAFRNATHSSCPPVIGGDYGVGQYREGCNQFRPYIGKAIADGRFRTIVLSGSWNLYDREPGFREDLVRTLDAIKASGASTVILGEPPFFQGYNRECELRRIRLPIAACRERYKVPDEGDSDTNQYLSSLASRRSDLTYLDVRRYICRNGTCRPYIDNRAVYYDGSHISLDGSWRIGSLVAHSEDYAAWAGVFNKQTAAPRETRVPTLPPMLGGYSPDFPYRVRSLSNPGSSRGPATVILEFDGDVQARARSIQHGLSKLGFRHVSTKQTGRSLRFDMEKSGWPKLTVLLQPALVQARGNVVQTSVVYFHW